jgi:hypothetical protein
MNEKWLIRLLDCSNEHLIAAYFTDNPSESLKTFYFCKEQKININIPKENDDDKKYEYSDKNSGSIYDIEVGFGTKIAYCYIDIWLEDIY